MPKRPSMCFPKDILSCEHGHGKTPRSPENPSAQDRLAMGRQLISLPPPLQLPTSSHLTPIFFSYPIACQKTLVSSAKGDALWHIFRGKEPHNRVIYMCGGVSLCSLCRIWNLSADHTQRGLVGESGQLPSRPGIWSCNIGSHFPTHPSTGPTDSKRTPFWLLLWLSSYFLLLAWQHKLPSGEWSVVPPQAV